MLFRSIFLLHNRWGCSHEEAAVCAYEDIVKERDGHMVHSAGLYFDLEHPFIGASPDGVIKCSVCGDGVLEVKCPHCCVSERVCLKKKLKASAWRKMIMDSGSLKRTTHIITKYKPS